MLKENVQEYFDRWAGERGEPALNSDQRIVVGVSGGPDSLALLHVLVRGGLHPARNVIVGHLDHRLRPASADEAAYVAALCNAWGVECHVASAEVRLLAEEQQLSLEEAGREARYRFLADLAQKNDARFVAVGHTADDQVETILMHFIRGSGLAGLRGMLPVGPLPQAPQLRLLRPLLSTMRAEVELYCRENDLQPVLDPSNRDDTFFRNRLRNELLPLLSQYNPGIKERILHMASVVSADHALLVQVTEQAWHKIVVERGKGWLRVDLRAWQDLPLSLRRRTLRSAVWELRASLRDVPFDVVEHARRVAEDGRVGAQATLPGNVELTVEYEAWVLAAEDAVIPPRAPQISAERPLALPVPGKVSLDRGWEIRAAYVDLPRLEQWEEALEELDPWRVRIDASVAGELHVRNRLPGERFRPLGLGHHSMKVADFMINEKLPSSLRPAWPIVANRRHVVWIAGYRIDERARVGDHTRRLVELHCLQR